MTGPELFRDAYRRVDATAKMFLQRIAPYMFTEHGELKDGPPCETCYGEGLTDGHEEMAGLIMAPTRTHCPVCHGSGVNEEVGCQTTRVN